MDKLITSPRSHEDSFIGFVREIIFRQKECSANKVNKARERSSISLNDVFGSAKHQKKAT